MRVKKHYRSFTVIFDILSDVTEIQFEKELSQIFNSFENTTLLNRHQEHSVLMKQQQANPKHILIGLDVRPFDDIRLLLTMINNFLLVTAQSDKFVIETLHTYKDDDEFIAYGSEIFLGSIDNITFSPSARTGWTNPQLIDKIIKL